MKPVALVIASFLAVVSCQETAEKPEPTKGPQKCESQCQTTYEGTNPEAVRNLKSCESGCRLLSIIESVDLDPFSNSDLGGTQKTCDNSCNASYKNKDEAYACKLGCEFQVPNVLERRKTMTSPLDSFFGNSGHGFPFISSFPRIQIDTPKDLGLPSFFSDNGIGSMFGKMKSEMDRMLNQVTKGLQNGEAPENGSGTLTVIKAGPGYHSQKTYNFGPEGVNTKTEEKTGKGVGSDMLSAPNPLERFFDLGDVELFKPKTSNAEESAEEEFDVEVKDTDEDFGIDNPFLRKEIAQKTVEDVQKMKEEDDARSFSNSVHGFDFQDILRDNLEGPRLPEEGLKSRHRNPPVYILREEMCSRNSEHMKWSDWVSCLHMRMGLPRWLTAATISLGIVFIIWLCLVIPHNAPKQKVKTTKAMEAANSVVKGGPVIVADRMDLPPAYEEIANLHVAVPVHTAGGKAGLHGDAKAAAAAAKAKEAEASAA